MKRTVLAAFSLIVLCSLSLLTVIVSAFTPGYQNTNYAATQTHTVDGKWTSSGEWTDAMIPPSLPATFQWRESWNQPGDIIQYFLVEAFTDNTNDPGDYVQLCYDRNADGGTAPQTDDIRVDYVGHNVSGLTLYTGNGTGWTKFTSYTYGVDVQVAETLGSSPLNSNAHWIVELFVDKSKSEFDISSSGYMPGIRVAVYDASNSAAGVQSWPPSTVDVPNNWGQEIGTLENIPESLTIVAIVLLSSVAVIAGSYFMRKRTKAEHQMAIIGTH